MIRVSHPSGILIGEIKLPSSKSISNRMLLLQKLYEPELKLDNLSVANDTQLLEKILEADDHTIYVQDAGTAFRFLTAYCSVTPGEWTVQGTNRLNERPINQLVDALKVLGADIEYLAEEGKAPLRIRGKQLQAENTLIDLTHVKSSQFISALLLIAPKVRGEFNLKVNTKMSSYSYVLLTIACLRRMGYAVHVKGQYISVSKQQKFDGEYFLIEPDWTSFFYWLSMAHIANEVDLFFPGLRLDNMHKERNILYDVGNSAMQFEEINGGLRLVKKSKGQIDVKPILNFTQFPDSAMTFAMLLPAIGCAHATLKGLESLKFKECDREEAITSHLLKMNVRIKKADNLWAINAEYFSMKSDTLFESFDDHRMAMCAAPLSLVEPIRIENESVVNKSYPHFWGDLKSVGFEIEYL
ncbi:hypothetical protein OAD66_08505 [Bacteroidia bacterium]|nr:hypothetical protein [Bacteroidia bacterium]MDB4107242.1 hypothetical protein [Bacteroidia bacterium]MDB9883157.1 hypothetical protein [Bacteroidia bacterium]